MIDPLDRTNKTEAPSSKDDEPPNPAPTPAPQPPIEEQEQAENTKAFDDSHPDDRFNKVVQGDEVSLQDLSSSLKKFTIGVGWDLIGFDESAADLDVSLFLLNKNDMTRDDDDFIFYKNLQNLDESVIHTGDSRSGAGSGDDEQIIVDLTKISFNVSKIMVTLTIHDPENKEYTFKNVRNVYMRIEDNDTERELFRYFLDEELHKKSEEGGLTNALYIGCFERDSNNWIFKALGETDEGGLGKIATKYGMVIVG